MGIGRKAKQTVFKLIRNVVRPFYGKNIWLISDRRISAGDNGEAFFKYLQDKDVNTVFAIGKESKDYDRLMQIGKVIQYDSFLYKLLLCVADCHCSSQMIHMESHRETPQIFLQHGVAEKDISKMINPASHENFYMITSSRQERDYMLRDDFVIDEDHLWLTGLTRFDYLNNNPQKIIVIAFTWRAYLSALSDEEFMDSKYYKTIKSIMEDKKLSDELAKRGYKLCLRLHPEIEWRRDLFPDNVCCSFYTDSYNKMYSEAELIVTDYSSAIFDFAYLRKSIIYYQFDGDEYYQNNPFIKKGFFDYEKDGFGPVVKDYSILTNMLIEMADKGCASDEVYKERMDRIFAFNDKNSCERTYKKIVELLSNK